MKQVTHFSSMEQPWGKSHTPKRYIHPPFAENIVTMWPNGTVLIGEIQGGAHPQHSMLGKRDESNLPSAAMALVYRDKFLDLKNVTYKTRTDGIPVHTLVQNMGTLTFEMESFCNMERVPTAYTKLVIRNNTDKEISDRVGVIARTGPEFDLLGVREPDGYAVQEPSIYRWMLLPVWQQDEQKMTDGTYVVHFQAAEDICVFSKDTFGEYFNFRLPPHGETYVYLAFGREKINEKFSYEEERTKTESFWEGELSRIKVFPQKEDPYFYAMYRSLVAQGLQMFCYPQGINYVYLRQGGLQRLMWPTDVRSMIRALARIGDFENYLDAIFYTYFYVMQAKNGEIINFGVPWRSVTGSVLFSFGATAMYSKSLYEKYKDKAYQAFRWIEEERGKSAADPSLASGLFPPGRASDYAADGQIWAQTDHWNLQGYALYAKGLKAQGDIHAAEVAAAFEDYMCCARKVVTKAVEQQKDSDILRIPVDARLDPEIEKIMQEQICDDSYELGIVNLGLLGDDTENARKVLKNHFEIQHKYENGLCVPFTEYGQPPEGRQWYGSWADMEVYSYYRRIGKDEQAKEILDAQLNYMMTSEYYMSERYADHDPYYLPWCPNCSANGRTISMLCDWYIDREAEK